MTGSRAAIRYAKAILETAQATGTANEVNKDMALVAATIKGNAELTDFIGSPVIKANDKQNALNEIFAGTGSLTKNLFTLLKENKRFNILGQIATHFNEQYDELNNIQEAVVTTAFPITPDLEDKVKAKIKEFSDKIITIRNVVNPDIIGGFILRIGDQQFNASVANRLQTLKRELSN